MLNQGASLHTDWFPGGNATITVNAHQTNLTNFIADVHATYGSGLKFGIARLSNKQTDINAMPPAWIR